MKIKTLLIYFLLPTTVMLAQEETEIEEKIKPTFFQFDLSIPFSPNEERGKIYSNGTTNSNSIFIPNGINGKIGYGLQKGRWVALSLHTGIEWLIREKLVASPVFGNLRLSPYIGYDTRFVLQMGYGKGFALGRGNLNGIYRKLSLGLETDEDLNIFVEISNYGFSLPNTNSVYSVNLGLSLRTF
jgi:hypothetical protein